MKWSIKKTWSNAEVKIVRSIADTFSLEAWQEVWRDVNGRVYWAGREHVIEHELKSRFREDCY